MNASDASFTKKKALLFWEILLFSYFFQRVKRQILFERVVPRQASVSKQVTMFSPENTLHLKLTSIIINNLVGNAGPAFVNIPEAAVHEKGMLVY